MTDRLVFVALRARDLDASLRFYRDTLGLLLEPSDEAGAPVHYECSWREGEYLHFALFPAATGEAVERAWIGFSTRHLESLHRAALATGARVVQEPTDEPWGRTAAYLGPDGNTVAVTERRARAVAGVDACPGGWAVAVWHAERSVELFRVDAFAEVLAMGVAAIAVDIPIGAPEIPPRAADVAARAYVGARASSVFPTPPRLVLDAEDYQEALRRHRALTGKGMSKQAYYLCRRMLEVEPHALADERIVEVHPEVSFRELARRPLAHSKHTAEGLAERRALLEQAGMMVPVPPAGVPAADAYDAAVAAWTAARRARGEARPLPEGHPQRTGAIWR